MPDQTNATPRVMCGHCGYREVETSQGDDCRNMRCTHQPTCIQCMARRMYNCVSCNRHHSLSRNRPCSLRDVAIGRTCRGSCSHYSCATCNNCIHSERTNECDECSEEVDSDNDESRCRACCPHGTYDDDRAPVAGRVMPRTSRPAMFTSPIKFWPGKNVATKKLSRRFIAAEIEVAGAANPSLVLDSVRTWSGSIVSDGSLPAHGFEINTSPASLGAYEEQVKAICESLSPAKGNGLLTSACGLHVHVDCRRFDFTDIRRLMGIWAIVENAMFAAVDPSRDGSRFCLRVGKTYAKAALGNPREVRRNIFEALYHHAPSREANLQTYKQNKYNGARYAAMNIHSWAYRGTIENRMFQGTINAEDIVNWGFVNAALADAATTIKDSELNELLRTQMQEHAVKEFLFDMLPDNSATWFKASLEKNSRSRGCGYVPPELSDANIHPVNEMF